MMELERMRVKMVWFSLTYLVIIIKQASPSAEEPTFPSKWREVIIFHLWWFKHVIVVLFHCNVYEWY